MNRISISCPFCNDYTFLKEMQFINQKYHITSCCYGWVLHRNGPAVKGKEELADCLKNNSWKIQK